MVFEYRTLLLTSVSNTGTSVLVLSRDVQLSTAVDNCILPFPFEKTGGETMSIITYENIKRV